jgi:hypothetical protein
MSSLPVFSLAGRSALATGAGHGIGAGATMCCGGGLGTATLLQRTAG